MTEWGVGSSVGRLCALTGALLALGLVAAAPALAAPSPDPPPLPAPPKAEPVQPTVTVVREVPVVTPAPCQAVDPGREDPAPVVRHSTPVAKAPVQRVKPKPAPAKVKPVVKPKAAKPAPVCDRLTTATGCPWLPSPRLRPRRPTRSTATCSRSQASGYCSLRWAAQSCSSSRGASWRSRGSGPALVALVLRAAGRSGARYAPVPTCSPAPRTASVGIRADVTVSWTVGTQAGSASDCDCRHDHCRHEGR